MNPYMPADKQNQAEDTMGDENDPDVEGLDPDELDLTDDDNESGT